MSQDGTNGRRNITDIPYFAPQHDTLFRAGTGGCEVTLECGCTPMPDECAAQALFFAHLAEQSDALVQQRTRQREVTLAVQGRAPIAEGTRQAARVAHRAPERHTLLLQGGGLRHVVQKYRQIACLV